MTLSGTAAFSVHTLQVDVGTSFNLNGGSVTFNTINLAPGLAAAGALNVGGNVTFSPLGGVGTAIVQSIGGSGTGSFGLGNGSRTLTITDGAAADDVSIQVPIVNIGGSITKAGPGTLVLAGLNTYGGSTTVNAGTLRAGLANTLPSTTALTVASGATFNLSGFNQTAGSLAGAGSVTLGAAAFTLGGANTSTTFSGPISGAGSLTKNGTGTQTLSGTNSFTGGLTVNAGKLQINRLHENNAVNITGGTLQVVDSSPTLPSHPAGNNAFVSRPSSLAISNNGAALGSRIYNGTLDLGNNDLIIDYSGATPAASIEDMVRSGYNGGNWLGKGIVRQLDRRLASRQWPVRARRRGQRHACDSVHNVRRPERRHDDGAREIHPPRRSRHGRRRHPQRLVPLQRQLQRKRPRPLVHRRPKLRRVFTVNDSFLFNGAYNEALASLPEPGGLAVVLSGAALLATRRRRAANQIA